MNNFKLTRNKTLGNIIEFESNGSVREIMYDVSDKIADIIEDLQKKAELGEHYRHLYSEIKKQKDDVVEYIKNNTYFEDNIVKTMVFGDFSKDLLRMLGETDVED